MKAILTLLLLTTCLSKSLLVTDSPKAINSLLLSFMQGAQIDTYVPKSTDCVNLANTMISSTVQSF